MRRLFTLFTAGLIGMMAMSFKIESGEEYPFDQWTQEVTVKSKTADTLTYLSSTEKEVVFYMNLVRTNPKLFAETFLQKYIDENNLQGTYVNSLLQELMVAKPLPALKFKKDLYNCAKTHATVSGESGKIGHFDFSKRFKTYAPRYMTRGENCTYGIKGSLKNVLDLLIDQNISDLGHRKNIMDADFKYVGISFQAHKAYKVCMVMDFGG
jgi:uncharacterized protein YkwD